MPAPHNDWTVEMVDALPDDGNRYEVIDGELFVSPAPSRVHQRAVAQLHLLLEGYARSLGLEVLFAPLGVYFSPSREVQPDLLVLPFEKGVPTHKIDGRQVVLVVEVLSPHGRLDRNEKLRLYQSEGIPDYWIVDPDARLVDRWLAGDERPKRLKTTLDWQPVSSHEALVIDLASYFRSIRGD